MPQTSAPSPRPQSAPQGAAARASKTSRPQTASHPQAASRPQGPARRTGQCMDFAPRRGNAASATIKPTSRPAAKPSPRSVSRCPAVKPAPKPVSSRPAQTAPRPTTPRRPALITSAREAMNAHACALREAQLETQSTTQSTTQSATQPAAQRNAHPVTSSAVAPEQGIAAPTSPRSAHNLHHAPAPTAPERPRVTPMPILPPPPPRPAAPVRAGTDPLVQRTRPLQRTVARPSAPQQQIKVSAPVAHPIVTSDAKSSARMKLPHLAAFSRATSAEPATEDTSLNNTRYALGEKSPFFLQSVSVEKRPLSSGRPAARPASRKNVYPKKPAEPKPEKPSLPTIVVPDSHRSKAPLIALIIFTILLGALVGAAAYLFFFQ